jgi:hypothetical protein
MSKKASENPPCYVIRDGDRLIGEMEMDRETIRQFPAGQRIRVELRTGRVPSRLRFWWAFLHEVVSATECCPTAEALHETVKLMCGYTTPVLVKGMTVMVPRSISFASMTEEEFTKFLADGLRFIGDHYGVTPEQTGVAA